MMRENFLCGETILLDSVGKSQVQTQSHHQQRLKYLSKAISSKLAAQKGKRIVTQPVLLRVDTYLPGETNIKDNLVLFPRTAIGHTRLKICSMSQHWSTLILKPTKINTLVPNKKLKKLFVAVSIQPF